MSATVTKPANRARVTTPAERDIHIERTFDASLDRIWDAHTKPELVAQWFGRGNQVTVERLEPTRGGHWRYVQQTPQGPQGFEGRYREVTPKTHIVRTFEWDGMPGHVIVEDTRFVDLGNERTKIVIDMTFHTTEERDGMLASGVEPGMNASYDALDAIMARKQS